MEKADFTLLSSKYDILKRIKFHEYEIKIWVMSHMDKKRMIDVQGFGEFTCESFMNKGKNYSDLINMVNFLTERGVFFIVDKNSDLIQYRFDGDSQFKFKNLMRNVKKEMLRRDPSELASLFYNCLENEEKLGIFSGNKQEHFRVLKKTNGAIEKFLYDFLNSNATSYANFILQLLFKNSF